MDERHEGQGLGAALLLVDVITRVASLSDAIGCRGLLVHAESEQARSFYEHLIPADAGVGGGRPGEASGVGCKPGGQIVRAVEIEQRPSFGEGCAYGHGLQLLQRQRLNAGGVWLRSGGRSGG